MLALYLQHAEVSLSCPRRYLPSVISVRLLPVSEIGGHNEESGEGGEKDENRKFSSQVRDS
jgi:hypothetical protein